jgi:hypothetical protein
LKPTTSSKWLEFLPQRTVSTDLVVGDLDIIEINYELTQSTLATLAQILLFLEM